MSSVLILLVIAALVVWLAGWRREVFRLEFRDGELVRERGTVSLALRDAFEDVAGRARVTGWVALEPGDTLRFSEGFGEADRQRLRNVLFAEQVR